MFGGEFLEKIRSLLSRANYRNEKLPDDFDPTLYLEINPDVKDANYDAKKHYLKYGIREGRSYKNNITEPLFSSTVSIGGYDHRTSSTKYLISQSSPRIVTYYGHQYYEENENGQNKFNKWNVLLRAASNFVGRKQHDPQFNGKCNDLKITETQFRQAEIAKKYGISAFCYNTYWLDGQNELEKPLDNMLAHPEVDIEFCVCWANENWNKDRDSNHKNVLPTQNTGGAVPEKFIDYIMKYLRDSRYMRVDGRLMILVDRIDIIPDCADVMEIWRDTVRRAGLGELHLCAVQSYSFTDPIQFGLDAGVECHPQGSHKPENFLNAQTQILNDNFAGHIFDYDKAVEFALKKPIPGYRWYRSVFSEWDITETRQHLPHVLTDLSLETYRRWMLDVLRQTVLMAPPEHRIVFVNAWNRQFEGAHIGKDIEMRHAHLEALRSALDIVKREDEPLEILARLRYGSDSHAREQDEIALLNILRSREQALRQLMSQLS